MFDEKWIREVIKRKIEDGINKFVIFPFGNNGNIVKNCLLNYFDLKPELIIDNEYSKYNNKIQNIESLKQAYEKNLYVILTAEDRELNDKLQQELEDFIPVQNIINFLRIRDGYGREITNQFSLNSFLPNIPLEIKKTPIVGYKNKIKIRFLHTVYAFWNSIETICSAFNEDGKYELLIILGNHIEDYELRKKQIEKRGYPYISWNEYNAEKDKADILIVTHLWEETVLDNCREYTNLIIVAAMSLIRYSYSTNHFAQMVQIGYEKFKPDYYLFDSLVYEEIKNNVFFKEKIVEIGNAKFDGIYNACRKKRYPSSWEKLKGKKTILWAPDHGINKGKFVNKIRDEITFDIYAKVIFKYFNKNHNIGMIFRPHPAFISEMREMNYWSLNDLNYLRNYCSESENVVFDENETYDNAYSISDAIITDALCGITCSALPTLKPICVLFRTDKSIEPFAKELVKNYYTAHNKDELVDFLNMIVKNEDPMLELRIKAAKKFVKHFDGKNGTRIKKFVEHKYVELMNQYN
jgi:hypothetical protein